MCVSHDLRDATMANLGRRDMGKKNEAPALAT
jgi:hypothetical protein